MLRARVALIVGFFLFALYSVPSLAAAPVSDADKAFVAMVSEGGMYEVALGKLAEAKDKVQDIRDQGNASGEIR